MNSEEKIYSSIREKYFDWIFSKITKSLPPLVYTNRLEDPFRRLLKKMDDKPFTYINPLDANRYEDGISLRYRFGDEKNVEAYYIAKFLDIRYCSLLEMIFALALRMSDEIMDKEPGLIFLDMLQSLGIYTYVVDSRRFNAIDVDNTLDIFLNRKYCHNGKGGNIFIVYNPIRDLRDVDIWTQMNWYVSHLYGYGV